MSFINSENKLVMCPYDDAHKVKASRLQLHIAKCKMNHLNEQKEICPFNATHLITRSELNYHLINCPDRAPLDRTVSQNALDKNNPFKGRTAVPTFSEPLDLYEEETWDNDEVNSFVPRAEAPPGAIIEPRPLAKPAERRRLYDELHRHPAEAANNAQTATPSTSTAAASKPSPVPRQPKQPSETLKFQNVQQQVNTQAIQNLGLGRGRSPRIAANIFENKNGVVPGVENPSYSNIVKDMSNLGLGRGQHTNQGPVPVPLFMDDDDFPALGCGRGVFQAPKQSLRTPGIKPRK